MKTATSVSIFLSVILFVSVSNAQLAFKADLDGAQAGTPSAATGTAILVYDPGFTSLNMIIGFNGITTAQITGFHIRQAPAGSVGPIVFGLVNPNNDPNNFADLGTRYLAGWDPSDIAAGAMLDPTSIGVLVGLLNEDFYFNAETAAFPNGEIRGQIVRVLFGDVNLDGIKSLLDVPVFVGLLNGGRYQIEADFNLNGVIDNGDIPGFIAAIIFGC